MTTKKNLKHLVRERQAKTGERYTTALASLQSKAKSKGTECAELHDLTEWAKLEGLQCRAYTSSERLWQHTETLEAKVQWFRALFAQLRSLLLALDGDQEAITVCDALLRGSGPTLHVPHALRELLTGRRFMAQVRAGLRGVSPGGRLLAFDVPGDGAPMTVAGIVFPERPPATLTLWSLDDESAWAGEVSSAISTQFLLAGIGGMTAGE